MIKSETGPPKMTSRAIAFARSLKICPTQRRFRLLRFLARAVNTSRCFSGSGKIAIAKIVIRTHQHLAAVKPQKKGLMLDLMHFPFRKNFWTHPNLKNQVVGKAEIQMAKQLIQSMTSEWQAEQYTDEYHKALEKIDRRKDRARRRRIAGPRQKDRIIVWPRRPK
jgi:non-homologous end joining protein Ku